MKSKSNARMGLQEANYKQYANILFESTSKFGINKEKTYLLLSVLIGNSDSSVKKEMSQKRIPANYVEAIRYILHSDSIYVDYFSMLLPFYRDQDSKESLIKMKLEVLKEKKKQPYWDKWIRLYEIKKTEVDEKNNVLDYFQKEEVNVDLPIAHAIKNIHLILCPNSNLNLIKKNYQELYTKIDNRLNIYERVYRSVFYLTYYSWLCALGHRTELSKTEASLKEKIREISFVKVEECIRELKELTSEKKEKDSNLRKTVRLLDLYYAGNKSMSDYEGSYHSLFSDKRTLFLMQSAEILNQMKPIQEDELLYRVWHRYYNFLYLQKLVEDEILNKNYFEIPERIRVALDCLEDIQRICRGGFNRIRIKCIYHKRFLEFIWSSIEAYLLEKETLSQFGSPSKRKQNHNSFSYDDRFNETVNWMKEQREIIVTPWD
ncbi:MAG: hypothetical protein IPO06_08495 [Leptospiraceae bacterium]|nr:hypothetical protein [Leptospiraceae bacterium]MBK9499381.1 hypothetical protein [Leptospiraceae bacterium]